MQFRTILWLRSIPGAALALCLSAGTASAVTTLVLGALDDGHACLASAGAGSCATESVFDVAGSFAIGGTLVVDEVAGTVDVDILLTSGSLVGSLSGVSRVVFTNTRYVVNDWAFVQGGNALFGLGPAAGSAVGTYTELDAGGALVGGPTAFGEATQYTALLCLFSGSTGQCGFTVGALRDFDLPVAGESLDFRETFNFGVTSAAVPEPSSALVFALVLVRRRLVRR